MKRLARVMTLLAAAIMFTTLALPALAQEELPVVTVEPATDVNAGDEVLVTVEGMPYPPSNAITISTCFVLPVTGPSDCDLTDFGEYEIEIDDTGAGEGTYVLPDQAARCSDPSNPCFILVSHGIGPSSVANGAEIVYAAGETTTTTAAETTTTVAETTTTEAPAETTTTTEAPAEDEGSALPWIIGGVVLVLVIFAAAYGLSKRNP